MAKNVLINVCFHCDNNDPIAELAKKHMEGIKQREAKWFLQELSNRTGKNLGPKGGLSMWGMVSNHVDYKDFVESLKPFWNDLINGYESDTNWPMLPHERIIVFTEVEQSDQAIAYEIYKEYSVFKSIKDYPLIINAYKCPFSWGQY